MREALNHQFLTPLIVALPSRTDIYNLKLLYFFLSLVLFLELFVQPAAQVLPALPFSPLSAPWLPPRIGLTILPPAKQIPLSPFHLFIALHSIYLLSRLKQAMQPGHCA
jgi:hypothetical protein